jgi:hypothetical protein
MGPVAEAKNNSTTETWTTPQAAHPLILKICVSPSLAGPWLAKQVFVTRQVRVRWQEMRPPSASAEVFLRPDRLPTVNFPDNSVETWEPPSLESCAVGICPVIMLGVEVVREDIVAQRPGLEEELAQSQSSAMHVDHVTIGNVVLPPSLMSRLEDLLAWLKAWMRPKPATPVQESETPGQVTMPNRQWESGDEWEWLFWKIEQYPPPTDKREKTAWSRKRLAEMAKDFGGSHPWKVIDTVRRRLDEALSGKVKDPRPGRRSN